VAKNATFGNTRPLTSPERTPLVVPGFELTNWLKFCTYRESANLLRPDRMNSTPNAVWISADAASAVLPLAGSRREIASGRILVVRRGIFITLISTTVDTTPYQTTSTSI
jgi:hypothetical protein